MKTRLFAVTVPFLVISLDASPPAERTVPGEPVEIGSRLELFVDYYLIDRLEGARLTLGHPRPAGTVLTADRPWEGSFNFGYEVIRDGGVHRLFYRGWSEGGPVGVCYAESRDGVRWEKPNLGLVEVGGTRENNVVALVDESGLSPIQNLYPFIDSRPGVPASERVKGIRAILQSKEPFLMHVYLYGSEDWFRWRRLREEPIIATGIRNAFDSSNYVFWSPTERLYVCYFRYMVERPTGSPSAGLRSIQRAISRDLIHWSEPQGMTYSDTGTAIPSDHLYTNNTEPYFRAPHLYVGLAARFIKGRRVVTDAQLARMQVASQGGHAYYEDCSDGVLLTTRPGTTRFDRTFLEALVRPGQEPENWVSRTNYPLRGVVQTGPAEMSFFVTRHYAQPSWHIERLTLRLDGFSSVRASYQGGEMLTRPLVFSGDRLVLNYATSAAGSLRVEVQDIEGRPVPGFSLSECREIIGDEIERPVTWEGHPDLGQLSGKTVRLRFVMKDADLYSMRFQ
ncbi:MAG: hypothetical protein OXH11_07330 [Candidatus Aminicenantes bacterium]|nr:hypothetical protein [Candidatus Aminicenantes bacterium]